MLKRGEAFVDPGQQRYQQQQCECRIVALKRCAAALGFQINPVGLPHETAAFSAVPCEETAYYLCD